MAVVNADYSTVLEALRGSLRHGRPLTQAETQLAINVIQHATLWLSNAKARLGNLDTYITATHTAGTPGTGIDADDLAAMIAANDTEVSYIAACADQPTITELTADAVLDGD